MAKKRQVGASLHKKKNFAEVWATPADLATEVQRSGNQPPSTGPKNTTRTQKRTARKRQAK